MTTERVTERGRDVDGNRVANHSHNAASDTGKLIVGREALDKGGFAHAEIADRFVQFTQHSFAATNAVYPGFDGFRWQVEWAAGVFGVGARAGDCAVVGPAGQVVGLGRFRDLDEGVAKRGPWLGVIGDADTSEALDLSVQACGDLGPLQAVALPILTGDVLLME
jgi:hypothetical protein